MPAMLQVQAELCIACLQETLVRPEPSRLLSVGLHLCRRKLGSEWAQRQERALRWQQGPVAQAIRDREQRIKVGTWLGPSSLTVADKEGA